MLEMRQVSTGHLAHLLESGRLSAEYRTAAGKPLVCFFGFKRDALDILTRYNAPMPTTPKDCNTLLEEATWHPDTLDWVASQNLPLRFLPLDGEIRYPLMFEYLERVDGLSEDMFLDCARILVAAGVDPHLPDPEGFTPIDWCLTHEVPLDWVRFFFDHGADVTAALKGRPLTAHEWPNMDPVARQWLFEQEAAHREKDHLQQHLTGAGETGSGQTPLPPLPLSATPSRLRL
jgi:hypothetical protein